MNSFLQVKVGDQLSNQLSTTDTGYGPPVLVLYEGEGAKDAITQGNQPVKIEGRNLGPAKLPSGEPLVAITSVTYGKKGTEYDVPVSECQITKDHVEMTCQTRPGAGKGMKWLLTIDGQKSITPSTWYVLLCEVCQIYTRREWTLGGHWKLGGGAYLQSLQTTRPLKTNCLSFPLSLR